MRIEVGGLFRYLNEGHFGGHVRIMDDDRAI